MRTGWGHAVSGQLGNGAYLMQTAPVDVTVSQVGNYTRTYAAQAPSSCRDESSPRSIRHAVSAAGDNSYGYDCNGNMITRTVGGNTFTLGYDAENRLVSVSGPSLSAVFVYDGDGNRVKSTINGVATYFVGNYYEVTGGVATSYYYAGSQRIAMRVGATVSYLLSDQLGSTSITTDASGNKTAGLRYDACPLRYAPGVLREGSVRYTSGTTATKYTYTGQYSNVSDFGLMYYNARWVDGWLGRFTSADTVVPGGVQGWDRYALRDERSCSIHCCH